MKNERRSPSPFPPPPRPGIRYSGIHRNSYAHRGVDLEVPWRVSGLRLDTDTVRGKIYLSGLTPAKEWLQTQ
jgi:hypothetical protein